jgi:Domain of unknown function (DUF4936)
MRELFVYYRVRPGHETSALSIVEAFQSRLRQGVPRLQARLLCRSEASGTAQTWMEIYAVDPQPGGDRGDGGITAELQQVIEAEAGPLAPCIEGSRHTEVFVAIAGDQSRRGRTIST